VAIVNETFAKSVWPAENGIGKRIQTMDFPGWITIVGVVRDAKHANPTEPPQAQLYVSHFQNPQIFTSLVARTSQPPMAIVNDVRKAIWSVDKDQPVWGVSSLESIVDSARGPWRFVAVLLGLFAVIAVTIASVGVYGVMSYSVSQRTQEIGIRVALGASPSVVRHDSMRPALSLVGAAVVAGALLAVAGARVAAGLLGGVGPSDPRALAAATLTLAVVALLACY